MKSISKEIFIIALLLMIVVFMIGMVFYKYMPNNKTVPEPVAYTAESTTTAVLQEIASSNYEKVDENATEVQDIIKSYSIGAKELTAAASKQTYISGKTNPFAEVSTANTNTVDGNNTNNNVVNPNNSNPGTTNNGSSGSTSSSNSEGTFFEKKGSK